MNNKGFISMTTILTIIIAVSVILIINIDIKMQNNNLINKVKEDARQNIKKNEDPICLWSPEIAMVKVGEKDAINTITLSCKHVDSLMISTSLDYLNNINNINEFFTIPENLTVDYINAYEITGGYKIVLGLKSSILSDNNTISLKKDLFCTGNICNKELKSNNIKVVEGS